MDAFARSPSTMSAIATVQYHGARRYDPENVCRLNLNIDPGG